VSISITKTTIEGGRKSFTSGKKVLPGRRMNPIQELIRPSERDLSERLRFAQHHRLGKTRARSVRSPHVTR